MRRRRVVRVAALVCSGLVVLAAGYLWVGRVYAVPSASMRPQLEPGDRIAVSRLDRGDVHRGDVVVVDVRDTWAAGASGAAPTVVKRVIGLPGERVVCCDDAGRIVIDGVPLAEPYLAPAGTETPFDVVVPSGRLWLLGDDRRDSLDSRHHLGAPGGGSVPVDAVEGRVVAVVWPLSRLSLVERPR
jgi:signal peptidase I